MIVSDGECPRGSVGCVVRMQTAPIMDWRFRIRPTRYSQFYAYKTLAAVLVPKPWPIPRSASARRSCSRAKELSRIGSSVFSKTLCGTKRSIQSVNSNLVAQSKSLTTTGAVGGMTELSPRRDTFRHAHAQPSCRRRPRLNRAGNSASSGAAWRE